MLVVDGTESRHGAEPSPVPTVLVSGTFEAAGDVCTGNDFYLGEVFGGWTMTAALKKRAPVMRLGAGAGTEAAHCADGHLAVLSGTMSQTLVTEAGVSYRIAYESYGSGLETGSASARGVCDVLVDGIVVQTILAVSGPDAVSHETYFTAQSDETVLSFSTVGRVPFTLGNATASKAAKAVF